MAKRLKPTIELIMLREGKITPAQVSSETKKHPVMVQRYAFNKEMKKHAKKVGNTLLLVMTGQVNYFF